MVSRWLLILEARNEMSGDWEGFYFLKLKSKSHSSYPIDNVGFKDSLTHWLLGIKDHVLKFCFNIGPFCINKKLLDVT